MTKPDTRTLAAVALLITGISASGIMIARYRGRTTIQTHPVPQPPTRTAIADNAAFIPVDPKDPTLIAEMIAETIARRSIESDLPQGDQLAQDARKILGAWFGGNAEDYLEYLNSAGHAPPPAPLWTDPRQAEKRASAWQASTAALRNARFDPESVAIRASLKNGAYQPPETPSKSVTGWRMNKVSTFEEAAPSADRLIAVGADVYEVCLPMQAAGLKQRTEYTGELAMSYMKDTTTDRWTLVAVSIYGLPPSDTAGIPPF